jgi:two-component system, sensor histidine kinase
MKEPMIEKSSHVSRRRYEREQKARAEAEKLLEEKSRALYLANEELNDRSDKLEEAVVARTIELQLALEQAKAASIARSRFIATMSHEIRTPLGGMLGMIDLLVLDEECEEKTELLNYAKTAGSSLGRIVNDVLDFSKMDAGVFVHEDENVDLRALIEGIQILAQANPDFPNRQINCHIAEDVPQLFVGDASRIRQVISNLVSNAIRYSTDGPITISAHSEDHPKGALLTLEVRDHGIGIPEDKFPDLFKDFSQVANSLTAKAQGAGLGLAICKRIMDSIGGKIDVESDYGEGSKFWFELPIEVTVSDSSADIASQAAPAVVLDGKHVLLAEDNVINQMLFTRYLTRLNMSVELAENGRIALDKFNPDIFDVVLIDIAMPEMDGLEATKRFREKWVNHTIPPIVALTAHVLDAIEEDVSIVGIDRVLTKPILFEEFETELNSILSTAAVSMDAMSEQPEEARSIVRLPAGLSKELFSYFLPKELEELSQKFVNDGKAKASDISQALEEGDYVTAKSHAHSLRGSSLSLGFNDLAGLAKKVEELPEPFQLTVAQELAGQISLKVTEVEESFAPSSELPS